MFSAILFIIEFLKEKIQTPISVSSTFSITPPNLRLLEPWGRVTA